MIVKNCWVGFVVVTCVVGFVVVVVVVVVVICVVVFVVVYGVVVVVVVVFWTILLNSRTQLDRSPQCSSTIGCAKVGEISVVKKTVFLVSESGK